MTELLGSSKNRITIGKLALVAATMTVGIIIYGAWVRVSGSGLGCPDWPLCDGIELTQLDRPALIEFGHRIYAGFLIAIVALGALLAFRNRNEDSTTSWIMSISLVAILLQAVLGLLTVMTELHGLVRLLHLLLAMSILGLLTVASVRNLDFPQLPTPKLSDATIVLIIGALLILIGGSIVGSGISASCPRFPLCGDGPGLITTITHLSHRILGLLLIVFLIRNSVKIRKTKHRRGMIALIHAITFMLICQGIVGLLVLEAFNGRFAYHESIRVIHLGLAAIMWWGLSALWAFSWEAHKN